MTGEDNQSIDRALLDRDRAGDEAAKEALVGKYLPMVHHIVIAHCAGRRDYEDLCQEGAIGLLKAINEFDPGHYKVKFSTFAYICILRRVANVLKQGLARKHRMLTHALSLNALRAGEDGATAFDLPAAGETDPQDILLRSWSEERLRLVLEAHLSSVEYAVMALLLQGWPAGEIQAKLGVAAKVVDNARTRARLKLRRLIHRYGSLLNPDLPLKARKRTDLAIEVSVG
ncbi:MAG: sigma-70 family RNA polymerase sigma factor [Patescibacteria group bacterium]